jgi:phosphotransferase system HPr (HPr) family protein
VVQASSEHAIAGVQVALPADVDLHARPAAQFVRTAMRFSSKLWVAVGEREADAKSLLSILALGAKRGTSLRLRAEGTDAAVALETLAAAVSQLRD